MKQAWAWFNLAAAIGAVAVNMLANILPINGKNTGQISDQFKVFFVPAGYVFAIWFVIYIGWFAFAIYHLARQRNNARLQRVGWLFVLSCVLNATWIFLWHYEILPLTVVVMLGLLLTLIAIYVRLDIGRTRVSIVEKWCVDIPFSIYLGWVSVATIANITDWLYAINWNGFGIAPEAWAVIMLVVATMLGAAMALTRGDVAFLAVLVWAFVGIANKQAGVPLVANTAWVTAVLVALMIPLGWWWMNKNLSARRASG